MNILYYGYTDDQHGRCIGSDASLLTFSHQGLVRVSLREDVSPLI